jgi:hypothetical protein
LAFAGFALVAGSHLLLAWWLAPETLADWMRLYYRVTFKSRMAGEGFDPQMWYLPWWVYWGTIFRASFFALPLALSGVYELAKGRKLPINAMVLSLLSPCLVFSFFRVKQPSYVYPAFPALALLIAYGVRCYFGSTPRRNLVVASLLSALAAILFFHLGLFGVRALAVVLILYLFFAASELVPSHLGMALKRFVVCASVCGMLFAGIMVWQESLRHRTYYREISSYMAPALRPYRPQDVVFTAPEFPAFQFYTFRSGQYWQTYYFHQAMPNFLAGLKSGTQAFYVVDPSGALHGGKVSEDKLAALREYATDVTPEIERLIGHNLGLKVFVPSQRHQMPNGQFVDTQKPRN